MDIADICNCSKGSVRTGWTVCTVISLIISSILIGVSLKKLSSVEYGIEYDRWAKELDDAAKQGGLHAGPPGYRFVKFPSTQISADLADTCVSADGLRVDFQVTFQYQMPFEFIRDAVEKYRDYKTWSQVVEAAGMSAIQHTCSEYDVTDFQSKRNAIQDSMFKNLGQKLEGKSIPGTNPTLDSGDVVTSTNLVDPFDEDEDDVGVFALASSLQLKNVELPYQYKNAVAQKQRAEEDINLAKNQRVQQTTRAETEKQAAEQEAEKIMANAETGAAIILTEAELKADETLFAFEKETEVLEQAKAKFNLTPNGVLAYMTNQLYASVQDLSVVVGEPARISRKDALSQVENQPNGEL
jgi:prohibitin 2